MAICRLLSVTACTVPTCYEEYHIVTSQFENDAHTLRCHVLQHCYYSSGLVHCVFLSHLYSVGWLVSWLVYFISCNGPCEINPIGNSTLYLRACYLSSLSIYTCVVMDICTMATTTITFPTTYQKFQALCRNLTLYLTLSLVVSLFRHQCGVLGAEGPSRSETDASPVISIAGGHVRGQRVPMSNPYLQPVDQYLGIPYATPPTGHLRFRPPHEQPPPWSGIRDATSFGPACPQIVRSPDDTTNLPGWKRVPIEEKWPYLREISEDCLYLNLYVPSGIGEYDLYLLVGNVFIAHHMYNSWSLRFMGISPLSGVPQGHIFRPFSSRRV